jgi:ribosomal protein S6
MQETHSADAEFTQASNIAVDKSTGAPAEGTQPIYEIGYHLIPTLTEEGVVATVQALRKALGSAEIIKDVAPVKIPLAYVIERRGQGKREKYAEAYFGFIKFALDKENIGAIEQYLRATHEVLRHLLIETVREDTSFAPRRAVFTSDRLEGEMLKKPVAEVEKAGVVSEEELDKSIDAIVA